MNAAARLGAFGLVLAAALAGGAGLGAAFGPEPGESTAAHGAHDASGDASAVDPVGGLAVAEQGYRLVAERTTLATAEDDLRIRIEGPHGVVRDFAERHTKELHLILVSRDLERYEHLHPTRDATGTWSVRVGPRPPGAYRAFADFQPAGGPALTLGIDLTVAGIHEVAPRAAARTTDRVDGFDVALAGDLAAVDAVARLRVTRDGAAAALEPYLGANGHLVAIREGDLAYLHVHPESGPSPAGEVRFALHAPTPGRYRLFFDFQVGGVVRTADFTIDVDPPAADATATSAGGTSAGGTSAGGTSHGH